MSFVLMLALSCNEKPKQETAFLDKKIAVSKKIAWVLKSENQALLEIDAGGIEFLTHFYKQQQYKANWVNDSMLTKRGANLESLLKNPLLFGLPKSRIAYPDDAKLNAALKELYLTHALAVMSQDLNKGFYDTVQKKQVPHSYPSVQTFSQVLNSIPIDISLISNKIISFGLSDTLYQQLAFRHYAFVDSMNVKDENFHVPTEKKDSLKSLNLAKKALASKGYLFDAEKDTNYLAALRRFQFDNGLKEDAVLGQTTVEALNETNVEKAKRSSLTLEKLRWRVRDKKRYIEVNIPEYTLRFYADDTLKSVNRIIVGKEDTQTPEFESELHSIISYPYWSVPFSITSKEILPDAKKNPNYFAKNNMKLYKNKEEIDPLSVNWKKIPDKTFPYKVIQQPGPKNSLGVVKFDFNNKYGVYFHDTPQKGLFNTVIRSYSHGCMRCENPVDLAKMILLKDENKMLPDSLDSMLVRERHYPIRLKKRIPVYVEYRSVVVRNDRMIFLRDIYRRDKRLVKLLFA